MSNSPIKIGLALGGGGARGLAHVGVLRVLAREGIEIHAITGASFGSIIGAMYACEPDVGSLLSRLHEALDSELFKKARRNFVRHEFEEERHLGIISSFKKFLKRQIFYSVALRMRQLVSLEEFTSIIDTLVPEALVENTKIPFACVATDISHGAEIVLADGDLRQAVYGSSAIPGVFPPINYRGRYLVDGGWSNRVPISPARQLGADLVIAVDISETFEEEPVENLNNGLELVIRANAVTGRLLSETQLTDADVIVRPDVGHLHWAAFDQAELCIRQGSAAMEAALPQLRDALSASTNPKSGGLLRRLVGKPKGNPAP